MKNDISLKDTIYNLVLDGIFHNEFQPNQIIHEKDLVQRYGYSKAPVREGLIALCNDNVLRSIPRYGYEVVRLTREDVEDMLRIRYLLEGGMLQLTYDSFSPYQLKKLEKLDDDCTRHRNDIWKHWESNTQFHLALMEPARNDYAWEILNRTMGRLKQAYAQFFWDRLERLDLSADTSRHREIIAALRNKDRVSVVNLLRGDLMSFGDFKCELPPYFGEK